MEFVPQPEEAKKFGTMKWFKWHLYKYPNVFAISATVPFIIGGFIYNCIQFNKGLKNGTYVPNVLTNRYAICRPDDWWASHTPKRYRN